MTVDGLDDRLVSLPRERAQALPALHLLHEIAGYLDPAGLEQIGHWLHIPNSDLYAVATSYTEFRTLPPEPGAIAVCRGLSCRLAGSDALAASLRDAGRRVEERECCFACAVAPVVEDDGPLFGRADTPERGRAAAGFAADPAPALVPSPPGPRPRLNLRGGAMARAVGAGHVLDALRDALPEIDVVETGGDGAAWAAPVLALPPDGPTRPAAVPVTAAAAAGVARALLAGAPEDPALHDFLAPQTRRLLARAGHIDPASLDEARAAGAYVGLKTALSITPEEIVDAVEASGLRGRGGAYFPVHLKWRAASAAATRNGTPSLVVNAEEGEPGVFKDRALMEADPHRLIEGVCIAAHAVGADLAFIYVNGQAALSHQRLTTALAQAEEAGVLRAGAPGAQNARAHKGSDTAGLRVEIRRGAGGYVCGEETVLLESIEGRRAVPRLRPPFPTERGLWGRPTVISNVETLCNLPDLFRFGVDWFRDAGTDDAPGTKLISLSGAVPRPGLIEVPMGATVAAILHIGGVADPAALGGVVAGGPSGGLLPATKLDLPIGPGALDEAGAVLGSGGIVAFDAATPVGEILQIEADYNARESCGKCTPCREGGERLAAAVRRLRSAGQADREAARADIDALIPLLRSASLCGLGQMAVAPVTSALAHFDSALTPEVPA